MSSDEPLLRRELPPSDPASPVGEIPDDREHFEPDALGLCLSGGGYRAMLFHLGALWRLNELGVLRSLSRISSVSGGSITAAVLGHRWKRLHFDRQEISPHFEREIVEPIRALASRTVDVRVVLVGALLPGTTIGDQLAAAYSRHLFDHASLASLPAEGEGPRIILNATNMQTQALFRFSRAYVADWRVGRVYATNKIPLALAVAASSAFPPFLSPVHVSLDPSDWHKLGRLGREPFTTRVVLTDGGIYDNLGLETVFKRCGRVLVSDAGKAFTADERPHEDWGRHAARTALMMKGELESIRKRQLIAAFEAPRPSPLARTGTYWGIGSSVHSYLHSHPELPAPIPFADALAARLAATPTRLRALSDGWQRSLVDWGYAICDTAMRSWVTPTAPPPTRLPYRARDAYADARDEHVLDRD